jgi:chaperonin GroES
MNLKPLGDRVIVKPKAAEEVTKSGLIIPDTAKEKPMEGEIVAVGAGKYGDDGKLMKMELKTGDKILYGKYSGTEVKINDEEFLIMRESDVYAIIQ